MIMIIAVIKKITSIKGSFIWYLSKIFPKINISSPLIYTRTSLYHGVRNVSFSEKFAYVRN